MDSAPWIDHAREFRSRLLKWLGSFFLMFCGAYAFHTELFSLLAAPLNTYLQEDQSMIFTALTEGFFVAVKTSLFVAFIGSLPVLVYQVWAFARPGLFEKEAKVVRPLFVIAPILFALGASFAYMIVLPQAIGFFMGFEVRGDAPILLQARISDYLSLIQQFIFAFGLCFMMPVFLIILGHIGVLDQSQLRSHRRFVFVGILGLSAVLTPPDVASQLMLATPMYMLFEITLMFMPTTKKVPHA